MIGLDYQRRLSQLLSESVGSYWVDQKSGFDYLYEASRDFSKEVKAFHNTADIATVASQTEYSLPPDFMEILTQDGYGNKTIQFTDLSGNVSWLSRIGYGKLLWENNTTSVSNPTEFAITDGFPADRLIGTATANGVNSGGESVLTDINADFSSVSVGDSVVNTTRNYIGVVLSTYGVMTTQSGQKILTQSGIPITTTLLVTAMFDVSSSQSAYANWTAGDNYFIQPQSVYDIVVNPPPATSGMIISVPYICRPFPVYSDYGSYSFATGYEEALLKYAVWLYKYRDSKGNQGDALYRYYDQQIRKAKNIHRGATTPKSFRVSFINR